MAKKEKESIAKKEAEYISYEEAIRVMEKYKDDKGEPVSYFGLDLRVKSTIKFEEMMGFITEVVNACINTDTGDYYPELFDYMVRRCFIKYYTNIKFADDRYDPQMEYELLYHTPMYEVIKEKKQGQINEIIKAAKLKIDFYKEQMVSADKKRLNKALSKFEDILMKTEESFDEAQMDNMTKLADTLSGIDEKDIINALTGAIANKRDENDKKGEIVYLEDKNKE